MPDRSPESPSQTPENPPPASARGVWLLTAAAIGFITVGSMLMGKLMDATAPVARLPEIHTVDVDLTATERDGHEVSFSDLRGKVVVCAYIYTVCPHGCAAVMGEMKKLNKELGATGEFHQASISVVPERDTPEMLASYAEALEVQKSDPWWFLSGSQENLWQFMTDGLGLQEAVLIPEEDRINPLDLYEHDLRVVLVDRKGMVRGYYSVFHPQEEIADLMREKLNKDARRLVEDPDA